MLVVSLSFLVGMSLSPVARAGIAEEYQVKAAFFYHFARFIEWPSEKFSSPDDPFRVCMLGKNPFQGILQKTLSNKKAHNRPFHFVQNPSDSELVLCHVAFIGQASVESSDRITHVLQSKGVLTIGESADFIEKGGIVRLFLEKNKVRFGVNPQAAQQAQLKISSKLLRLAKIERP